MSIIGIIYNNTYIDLRRMHMRKLRSRWLWHWYLISANKLDV